MNVKQIEAFIEWAESEHLVIQSLGERVVALEAKQATFEETEGLLGGPREETLDLDSLRLDNKRLRERIEHLEAKVKDLEISPGLQDVGWVGSDQCTQVTATNLDNLPKKEVDQHE